MLEKMVRKAIILAGGKGERLRPLTLTTPKPLLEFRGKMIIEYIFDMLKKENIRDVTLTLCYKPEVFKETLGDGKDFGLNINYIDEEEPLGTAGFLKLKPITETTLVINSDVFFNNFNINDFLQWHNNFVEKGAVATLTLTYVKDTEGLGTVKLDSGVAKIEYFMEKEEASNYVSAGYYLLEPTIMDYLPNKKKIMFEIDLFPKLAKEGKLFAYLCNSDWIHIRDLNTYEQLKNG